MKDVYNEDLEEDNSDWNEEGEGTDDDDVESEEEEAPEGDEGMR